MSNRLLSIGNANRSKHKFYSQHRFTKVDDTSSSVDRLAMENNRGSNSEILSTSEQYGVLPATRAGGAVKAMYPGT